MVISVCRPEEWSNGLGQHFAGTDLTCAVQDCILYPSLLNKVYAIAIQSWPTLHFSGLEFSLVLGCVDTFRVGQLGQNLLTHMKWVILFDTESGNDVFEQGLCRA
jgi:hypothetical protein